jgi:hypothetical protein
VAADGLAGAGRAGVHPPDSGEAVVSESDEMNGITLFIRDLAG